MTSPAMSMSSLMRRLFVMILSGVVVVALTAAPAEAKKKKKSSKKSAEASADAESGSKKSKKSKKKSKGGDKEEAKVEKKEEKKEEAPKAEAKPKKERKEFAEDDEAPAPKAAPSKAAPVKAAETKAAAAPAPVAAAPVAAAPVAAAVEPMPLPPPDDTETVISRTAGLGRLKIEHVNEVASSFRLTKLAYDLNNHPIYPADGKPEADLSKKTIPIWEGVLPIGDNEVKVTALYQGVGNFFSYLNEMTFKKSDTTKVKVTEGQLTTLAVIGQEDTSPFTPTEDRPRFDYRTTTSAAKSANIR